MNINNVKILVGRRKDHECEHRVTSFRNCGVHTIPRQSCYSHHCGRPHTTCSVTHGRRNDEITDINRVVVINNIGHRPRVQISYWIVSGVFSQTMTPVSTHSTGSSAEVSCPVSTPSVPYLTRSCSPAVMSRVGKTNTRPTYRPNLVNGATNIQFASPSTERPW